MVFQSIIPSFEQNLPKHVAFVTYYRAFRYLWLDAY